MILNATDCELHNMLTSSFQLQMRPAESHLCDTAPRCLEAAATLVLIPVVRYLEWAIYITPGLDP